MNAIFTNINQYANVHEAFRLQLLDYISRHYGLQVFVYVMDDHDYPEYPNITYSNEQQLSERFLEFYKKYKPEKICNFIDYLTRWDLLDDVDCQQVYFVRSCYAEVLIRTQQPVNERWLQREQSWIRRADVIVTDCPESNRAIKQHYNLDSEIVLEYVNPGKYLEVEIPVFAKKAYYAGRFDKQKRFNLIQTPSDWQITGIGRNELDERPYSAVKSIGVKPFEEYINHIRDAAFGLYPAVWESNGYGVQECLAMGKIPVIQQNSGGPERLCNHSNSIILDYETELWYEQVMDLYTPEMHEAAKQTLTQKMFDDSLDKFAKVME